MPLEGRGEVRNRGVPQKHGYLGYCTTLFVQQILGMLYALALIKIKDRGAVHLFEAFFKVALVDSHFTAQLLDGDRLTNMLNQNFSGFGDLFTISLIGQKLTTDRIQGLLIDHAIQTLKQEHLSLRINKDILQRIAVFIIENTLQGGSNLGA